MYTREKSDSHLRRSFLRCREQSAHLACATQSLCLIGLCSPWSPSGCCSEASVSAGSHSHSSRSALSLKQPLRLASRGCMFYVSDIEPTQSDSLWFPVTQSDVGWCGKMENHRKDLHGEVTAPACECPLGAITVPHLCLSDLTFGEGDW